jgi:hypothetical protein
MPVAAFSFEALFQAAQTNPNPISLPGQGVLPQIAVVPTVTAIPVTSVPADIAQAIPVPGSAPETLSAPIATEESSPTEQAAQGVSVAAQPDWTVQAMHLALLAAGTVPIGKPDILATPDAAPETTAPVAPSVAAVSSIPVALPLPNPLSTSALLKIPSSGLPVDSRADAIPSAPGAGQPVAPPPFPAAIPATPALTAPMPVPLAASPAAEPGEIPSEVSAVPAPSAVLPVLTTPDAPLVALPVPVTTRATGQAQAASVVSGAMQTPVRIESGAAPIPENSAILVSAIPIPESAATPAPLPAQPNGAPESPATRPLIASATAQPNTLLLPSESSASAAVATLVAPVLEQTPPVETLLRPQQTLDAVLRPATRPENAALSSAAAPMVKIEVSLTPGTADTTTALLPEALPTGTTQNGTQSDPNPNAHGEEAYAAPAQSVESGARPHATPAEAPRTSFETVRTEAARPADAAPPPSESRAERVRLAEQVSRHLESLRLVQGRGELTFRLDPDTLGALRLTLSSHADGIHARMITETVQAQHAVEGAKEQLRAALENKGLRLSALEVSVGQGAVPDGHAYSAPQDAPREREFFRAPARSSRSASADDAFLPALSGEDAERVARLSDRISRLDYRV